MESRREELPWADWDYTEGVISTACGKTTSGCEKQDRESVLGIECTVRGHCLTFHVGYAAGPAAGGEAVQRQEPAPMRPLKHC